MRNNNEKFLLQRCQELRTVIEQAYSHTYKGEYPKALKVLSDHTPYPVKQKLTKDAHKGEDNE